MNEAQRIKDLTEWAEAVTESKSVLADNTKGRDRRIIEAAREGISHQKIAEATGVARSRVYQITRR